MAAGLCACVVLAVLCTGCFGVPFSSRLLEEGRRSAAAAPYEGALLKADGHQPEPSHVRHRRSASQLKALPLSEETDSRANLSELLARLISTRKGSVRRNSTANSRGVGLGANHRIADRDYLGWMDFGRRSAEEYEYSS